MNKSLLIWSLPFAFCTTAFGQSAIDGYRISQPDMKGTARFMGMAGAFGALGGDLSTLSQNPAGIGVYRSGDLGFTLNLDCQSSSSEAQGMKYDMTQTKFLLNNIGAVVTMRLPSVTFPNLNFGFTYNKGASFNRQYGGKISQLSNSMSNYIAGIANGDNLTENDLVTTGSYDPYNPTDGGYVAPWMAILGYDGYLITPSGTGEDTRWFGQWGDGTSGSGNFYVNEKGSMDEYNIALGGNIADVVYWGMNFDIVNFNYGLYSVWGENLSDAYVPDNTNTIVRESSNWNLNNFYNITGSGFNYQLGLIAKPIQELRIGFAVHTPTWYNLTESFNARLNYNIGGENGSTSTNGGYLAYNDMCFRTPWKFIASAAGVIGGQFIISLDYEWTPYNKMKFSAPGSYGGGWNGGWNGDDYWGDDWDYPWYAPAKAPTASTRASYIDPNDPYYETNSDINTYYQATNTIRVGAEYRITPAFSVRAGYSHTTSPVKTAARNDSEIIYTSGTLPNYRFDKSTDYITCGFGYRYKKFYVDMAYVYKNISSEYHAYTPDPNRDINQAIPSPQSKLSLSNSQIVLSAGFRF
ncbi:MAG: hypothetical protein HDR88_00570 [Bacteroides sp.]|nr:hypothetical protein [Bacteroides sp.]